MFLTEAEAATEIRADKKTVRKLILSGRLRAIDVGSRGRRHFRIDPSDLKEIAPAEHQKAPLPPPISRRRRRPTVQANSVAAYLPSA